MSSEVSSQLPSISSTRVQSHPSSSSINKINPRKKYLTLASPETKKMKKYLTLARLGTKKIQEIFNSREA